ncbi:MAG: hypothetical protein ABIS86_22870 [Streptosporangiaceae bacterium]
MGTPSAPPPPGSVPPPLEGQTLPPGHSPNPAYRQLFQSYAAAYGSIDQVRRALDPALRTLSGTDAWIGPESKAWGDQLTQGQGDLRKAADTILWDIYNRLSSTQRTVPTA